MAQRVQVTPPIVTGEIIEQQRDRKRKDRKYLVRGQTVQGEQIAFAVSKFGTTGKLVILTVYVE